MNLKVPSSSVVTFTIELLLLLPTAFVANTLIKYFVKGKSPVREALVEELDNTQEPFERVP